MSDSPAPVARTTRASRQAMRPDGTDRRGGTAAAGIYRSLRAEIISMQRKPGEAIIEKQVGEAHGVSRTPIREALLRLNDEGLIQVLPQSGTFVAPIPLRALPEAIVIRQALEAVTVRAAAVNASDQQVAELQAILKDQHEASLADDAERFHEGDEAFHAAIAEAAGYPGIWPLIQKVKVQVDRYRRLTLPMPGRIPMVVKEHSAVLRAIERRDPDGAVALMGDHLDGLQKSIATARANNPEYFIDGPLPADPALSAARRFLSKRG